jgi:hypothetical protein
MTDRKVRVAAFLLRTGRPLSIDLQTHLLSLGIDLRAFERRFAI